MRSIRSALVVSFLALLAGALAAVSGLAYHSAYQALRAKAESEWVPAMKDLLALESQELPVIWDADFLYGPRDPAGADTYVLCEINISAVWPFTGSRSSAGCGGYSGPSP